MASKTSFVYLNQEQADKMYKLLAEVGFTGRLCVTAYDSEGDMFQATIEPPKPDPDSYETRKAVILSAITNRKDLPWYAYYGNHGEVYLRYKNAENAEHYPGKEVHGSIPFYEIIEAVARRILKSVTP